MIRMLTAFVAAGIVISYLKSEDLADGKCGSLLREEGKLRYIFHAQNWGESCEEKARRTCLPPPAIKARSHSHWKLQSNSVTLGNWPWVILRILNRSCHGKMVFNFEIQKKFNITVILTIQVHRAFFSKFTLKIWPSVVHSIFTVQRSSLWT